MTVNIHGKKYVEVKDRVLQFRQDHPNWSIITNIENIGSNNSIIVSASVQDEDSRVRATGLAHEWQGDDTSMVNKTSWVENCETSAIGRALASLGYGIEEAYASSNEVQRAKAKEASGQIASTPTANSTTNWRDYTFTKGKNIGKKLSDLSSSSLNWYIENWESQGELRTALDQAKAEMQGDPVELHDDISEQTNDSPTAPEEDELW